MRIWLLVTLAIVCLIVMGLVSLEIIAGRLKL